MESYVELPSLDFISEEGRFYIDEAISGFDFNGFVEKIVSGENIFKVDSVLDFLMKIFTNELYSAIKILTVIIGIVLINAILENLYSSFGKINVYNSSFTVLILILALAVKLFSTTAEYAQTIAGDMTTMMTALLPVLMTLTAGCGYVSLSMSANPVLLYMCNIFSILFDKLLIPASVVYLAVSMLDMLTETVKLSKLRELIKRYYNFVLGIVMTLFTGVLSAGSFASVTLDSVGARGARFALSNLVPFVGRSLSEAMNAVASASFVLKNAVGITGIVVIILLCAIPVIRIAAVILCIRIASILSESISGKKTVEVLSCVGDSLSMIQAGIISIAVMMIISIGVIVGMCR